MKLIPETLDNVSWSGKPIKDLTREELELAFLGILQLYFFEREVNRKRLDELELQNRKRLDELELQWNKEIDKWRNDNKRKSFDKPWWKKWFE